MEGSIFVYGSLMSGFWNYDLALKGNIQTIKAGKIRGKLFHLNHKGYPAVIEGNDWVFGEYMSIKNMDHVSNVLDKIENYFGPNDLRNEYEKVWVRVYSLNSCFIEKMPVYFYQTNHDSNFLKEGQYISHGSWREFISKK